MEFELDWGRPALGRDLNEEEIHKLMERLQKKAADTNVFSDYLIPAEIEFVKKNIPNCYLIRITDDISPEKGLEEGVAWVIIGKDEVTAKYEYSKI